MTMPADLADAAARDRARGALVATLQGPDFLRRFRDIRVEPAATPRGWPAGPSRAALSDRDLAWHWVNGHPSGKDLPESDRPPIVIDEPLVWGGAVMSHFGHTIAEQFQRVLFSRLVAPEASCLFSLPKGWDEARVPGYFWGACDWFGLPRDRVRLVTDRPVLARDLTVLRQGEQFQPAGQPAGTRNHAWCGPLPEYLAALNLHQAGQGLATGTTGMVYVSRSRLSPGEIPIPGEALLVERMQAAGVEVIWPETLPIRDQLAAFARARTLIFAEGSAMHVRQFLGYLPQHVVVISRRRRMELVEEGLRPRCERLTYIDAVAANVIFTVSPMGVAERWRAFPLMDQDLLLEGLAAAGLDLRAGWDRDGFERAQETLLHAWAEEVCRRGRPADLETRLRLLEGSLLGAGLGDHLPRLKRIAMAADAARQTGPAA